MSTTIFYLEKIDDPGKLLVAASIPQIHLILYSVQSLVFPNLPPQKKQQETHLQVIQKINPSPNTPSIFPTPFQKLVYILNPTENP